MPILCYIHPYAFTCGQRLSHAHTQSPCPPSSLTSPPPNPPTQPTPTPPLTHLPDPPQPFPPIRPRSQRYLLLADGTQVGRLPCILGQRRAPLHAASVVYAMFKAEAVAEFMGGSQRQADEVEERRGGRIAEVIAECEVQRRGRGGGRSKGAW